jgi:3-isopropylmalate/(R)-2-methylmalate dehydratase large subunit
VPGAEKIEEHAVKVSGKLGEGVTSKDVVLAIIGKIGTAGGNGHAIEFGGQVFRRHEHGRPYDRLQHGD